MHSYDKKIQQAERNKRKIFERRKKSAIKIIKKDIEKWESKKNSQLVEIDEEHLAQIEALQDFPSNSESIRFVDVHAKAVLLRAHLKVLYHNSKFKVTSSHRGGASIDVVWFDGDYPYGAEKICKLYSDGKWDPRTDEDTHDNYVFVKDSNGEKIADTPEIFEEWQNDVNLPTMDEYYSRKCHSAEEKGNFAEALMWIDKAIAVKPGYMYYLRKSSILLSIIFEKYTKSALSFNLQKKAAGGKISKPAELISLIESDKTAKKIVKYFGYEKGALLDVLSAYYNKEFRSRIELADLTKNSEVQEYLTKKTKRIENLEDWRDFARNVVPQIAFLKHEYDDFPGREGRPQMRIVIENLFRDFSYKFLGAYPTYEKVEEMLNCMQDVIDEN